jgi:DDE superfamily endonuclease
MTTEVYIRDILPQIADELRDRGLTLIQDANSAHKSKATQAWAKEHGVSLLTLPGVSPDFSILESMARSLKKKFHTRRCASETASKARFAQIFKKEMDQKMIQKMYNSYTKRLHDCNRADGQMTKY